MDERPDPDPRDLLAELVELQRLSRLAGVSFAFPLGLYGVAGIGSALLARSDSLWWHHWWWIAFAVVGPTLVARHVSRRLATRGVGLARHRLLALVTIMEVTAAVLWFSQPLAAVLPGGAWLAVSVGTLVGGRLWGDRALPATGVAVAAAVVITAAMAWPMWRTDLAVGVLLCAAAAWWLRPRRHAGVHGLA